ncbi:MAG: hypothetical protein HC875_08300 [Anaerolineales bacterium]|nr:hypothetical protein [Anaerolineales bacterium]
MYSLTQACLRKVQVLGYLFPESKRDLPSFELEISPNEYWAHPLWLQGIITYYFWKKTGDDTMKEVAKSKLLEYLEVAMQTVMLEPAKLEFNDVSFDIDELCTSGC